MSRKLSIIATILVSCFVMTVTIIMVSCNRLVKSKYIASQNELHKTMSRLHRHQTMYHSKNNRYQTDLAIELEPREYRIYFGNDVFEPDLRNDVSLPDRYKPYASPQAWKAYCVDNLDSDTMLDIWSIDESGRVLHEEDDTDNVFDWIEYILNGPQEAPMRKDGPLH